MQSSNPPCDESIARLLHNDEQFRSCGEHRADENSTQVDLLVSYGPLRENEPYLVPTAEIALSRRSWCSNLSPVFGATRTTDVGRFVKAA